MLKAIAVSKVFVQFAHAFTSATGLPVTLRPVECFQLSLRACRSRSPFCALMAQDSRTCGTCLLSQAQIAEAAVEQPHTGVCHAGLCETAVPLSLGSRLIGHLWTGQVFLRKPTESQFQRTLTSLARRGIHPDQDALRNAFYDMRVLSREQHTGAVRLLTIFAEHLATLSNHILIQRGNAEPPSITKARDFIRRHHTEDLSLLRVAQSANASSCHFSRLFKRTTGLSFTTYLSRVRVESAKDLLVNPQLRISEAAFEAGFQSLTQFNRAFQKTLGQSPTEFRQRVRTGSGAVRSVNAREAGFQTKTVRKTDRFEITSDHRNKVEFRNLEHGNRLQEPNPLARSL